MSSIQKIALVLEVSGGLVLVSAAAGNGLFVLPTIEVCGERKTPAAALHYLVDKHKAWLTLHVAPTHLDTVVRARNVSVDWHVYRAMGVARPPVPPKYHIVPLRAVPYGHITRPYAGFLRELAPDLVARAAGSCICRTHAAEPPAYG